jgi:type VI secretion system protein VasI
MPIRKVKMTKTPSAVYLLVLFLVSQVSELNAADDHDIAICAGLTNSVEQLACFDDLAKRLNLAGPNTQVAKEGKWSIHTKTSLVDDSTNVFLFLSAESEISGWPSKISTPELIIRCKENKTEMYINTGIASHVEYGNTDSATVTLRLDKEDSFTVKMGKSTDGEALFFSQPIVYVKRLMNHSQLLFQFTPFNSSPTMTTFELDGLKRVIKPLRTHCHW